MKQQRPSPHVVKVEGKSVETSFSNFIQINRSEEMKTERKPWIGSINFT